MFITVPLDTVTPQRPSSRWINCITTTRLHKMTVTTSPILGIVSDTTSRSMRVSMVLARCTDQKDLYTQLVISGSLGLSAFLAFAVLRPRWSSLYAARKKQRATASSLPDLPDTLFGWIPVLYRISEKEVLTAAGLDAWVVCYILPYS